MQPLQKIQTLQSIISTPFITCEFGGEQFGLTSKYNRRTWTRDVRYLTGLTINKKASGQVNTYSLNLNYVVEPGADPNYIDLVISRATDRKILFSYGDASQPEYSFVKEQAIMTTVVPNVNVSSHSISYVISATSSVSLSYSIKRNFPAKTAKPSDVIFDVIYNNPDNGLLELFSGMRNRAWVEEQGLIARNDREVYIGAQSDISPLDYIRLLVSMMSAFDNSFYAMVIYDEPDNIDGPYFSVINSTLHQGKGNRYSVDIDVGYPSDTPVYSFTVSQNSSLALITPYQDKFDQGRIVDINVDGSLERSGTPSLAVRNGYASTTLKQWWKSMTNYPVNAVLKTRGLIKPSILCDYIKVNVLFFGQPYTYSGYYMVTAQKDDVTTAGYSTELSLVRVEGLDV